MLNRLQGIMLFQCLRISCKFQRACLSHQRIFIVNLRLSANSKQYIELLVYGKTCYSGIGVVHK